MVMVMNMMHHAASTPSRSPAHGFLRDRLSAIGSGFGIIGGLLGAAGCRLRLRSCCLRTLGSRIRAGGRLIGGIGRVDRVLLRRRVAGGASTRHQRQQQN
jgi:hypothetical protein